MKLPNLIIGGAPKCGTSSLYFWLAAHPNVFASPTKETFYFADKVNSFNKNCNCIEHEIGKYAQFFNKSTYEDIRFEATAAYLYADNAIKKLLSFNNPPQIIFIFREPSAQIFSHYKMERYRTKKMNLSIENYVKLAKIDNYVQYAKYLKKWLAVYPKERIKLLVFEDLMSNKVARMQEIASFLGIDTNFYKNFNFEHRNESVAIRISWIHQLGLKLQPLIPHKIQTCLLPIYIKLNSSGRIESKTQELAFLATIKEKYRFVKEELLAIDANLPLHLWD